LFSARFSLITGSLFGGSGVVLGAWGAHGLENFLGHNNISSWETAVLYQLVHTPCLLLIGVLINQQAQISSQRTLLNWVAPFMILGIVLFSGSLYVLVLGGPSWFGPVTPLGGVSLIGSWLLLAIAAWRIA
jgi:uncharacterized membrane protein YgdD (TMEM256/DUF423 family)